MKEEVKIKISYKLINELKDDCIILDEIYDCLKNCLNEDVSLNFLYREHGPFNSDDETPYVSVGYEMVKKGDKLEN
jgi:hypothetical protein